MKFLPKLSAIIVAFSLPVSAVQACSFNKPIFMRIAEGYESGRYTSVLLAQITGANHAGEAYQGEQGWAAKAVPLSDMSAIIQHPDIADGLFPEKGKTFDISRTGSSAACDDGVPKPRMGDIWIMYMHNDQVVHSYPIQTAYLSDPKLQSEWIIRNKDGSIVEVDGSVPGANSE